MCTAVVSGQFTSEVQDFCFLVFRKSRRDVMIGFGISLLAPLIGFRGNCRPGR